MHPVATLSAVAACCLLQSCKKPPSQVELKANIEQQQDEKNKALCITETLAQLKDPDSAKITEMIKTGPVSVELAGGSMVMRVVYEYNVNAKNSYGGYTGKQRWACDFVPDTNEYKGAYRRQ